MWWVVVGVCAVVLVGAVGVWLLGPTLKTMFGPGFEPTDKDPESVYRAQSSGDSHGAGQ
jgi:hypothetical protein